MSASRVLGAGANTPAANAGARNKNSFIVILQFVPHLVVFLGYPMPRIQTADCEPSHQQRQRPSTGFYFIGREHWERWLLCLLGFVLARHVARWLLTHSQGQNQTGPAQEASYAPWSR
jgi:hypothetical protein